MKDRPTAIVNFGSGAGISGETRLMQAWIEEDPERGRGGGDGAVAPVR